MTITSIPLVDAEKYVTDIRSIREATTGNIDVLGSNLFFEEVTQMLINAISLFQDGFIDCAFYSLRESIELSIGTIYLSANKDKVEEWTNLKDGFKQGRMAKFQKEPESVFQEVREKLPAFFENVRRINKYAHKQEYDTFYTNITYGRR